MTELAPEQDPEVWSRTADNYAEHIHHVTGMYATTLLERMAIQPGERVVDIACGSGAASFKAARAGARVLATDITPRFLEIMDARIAAEGIDNVETACMDGQALDLDDGAFDAAMSNFGVFLFPDRAKGFAEMFRVVRPGGRAATTCFGPPPEDGWMMAMMNTIADTFPELLPPGPPVWSELTDPSRLEAEIGAAGFEDVSVEEIIHTHEFSDVDAAWAAMAGSAPIFRGLIDEVGAEGGSKLRARFTEIMTARAERDGALRFPTPGNLAVAHKA